MTFWEMPICLGCRHYDRTAPGPGFACTAFPDGIPDEIFYSEADHREPFEGDQGIRFDPVDDEAAAYAEDLFNPILEEPYREDEDEPSTVEERAGIV
jgi:hypothetical protein